MLRGRKGQAYNIGVEEPEISMLDLAERVVKIARDLFDYKGRVVHQPTADQDYLADNPSRRCPNIDKARNELKYNPSISLDEGLKRSLMWYFENQNAEEA
jgi:nucleoside-diphosphate-sugar epimerase